jgi:hypothetical protein
MPTLRERLQAAGVSADGLGKLSGGNYQLDVQEVEQAFLGIGDKELDILNIRVPKDRSGIKSIIQAERTGVHDQPQSSILLVLAHG